MVGEFFALGSALSWAGGSVVLKPLTRSFHPLPLNALRTTAGWVFLLFFLIFIGWITDLSLVPPSSVLYILASGIIGIVIGTSLYIKSLSLIPINIAFPVTNASWILFVTFFAIIFLDEAITWLTLCGAILIMCGITLLAAPGGFKKLRMNINMLGFSLALLTGIIWAVSIILIKLGLHGVNPVVANFLRLPVVFLLLWGMSFKQGDTRRLLKSGPKKLSQVGAGGIFDQALGSVFFFAAIQRIGAAKATILSSTSPLFVLPFSILLFKEKVTFWIILGTLLCVGGIWLVV